MSPRATTDRTAPAARRTRRRTRAVRGGGITLALAAAAMFAVPKITADRPTPLVDIGVARNAAGCTPLRYDPPSGTGQHVPPGTTIDYATVPPSSGPHVAVPAHVDHRGFYTTADAPPVEALVHNLEHGYTIAWYTPDLPRPDLDALRHLAERLRQNSATSKFIAAPWDPARGEFPPDTPFALTHWSTQNGYRQFCARVSGEVVLTFMIRHPAAYSPEPFAALTRPPPADR